MSNVSFMIKQDKTELGKQKMIVSNVADITMKSLFGMCDCTVDSAAEKGDFSIVPEILHVCGNAYVRSHVSLGMGYTF